MGITPDTRTEMLPFKKVPLPLPLPLPVRLRRTPARYQRLCPFQTYHFSETILTQRDGERCRSVIH